MSTEITAPAKRLWEIDHPYYCNEGSYYASGSSLHDVHQTHDSWADFLAEWEHADLDMNLIFRWDWDRANPEDYRYELDENPAFEIPGDTLKIFYFMQRKARNLSVYVSVTEADDPAVREWLTVRAEHMRTLWEPLLEAKS